MGGTAADFIKRGHAQGEGRRSPHGRKPPNARRYKFYIATFFISFLKENSIKEKADDLLMAENHQMRAGTSSEKFFIWGLYIANVLGH
jgi:hypothetical protein